MKFLRTGRRYGREEWMLSELLAAVSDPNVVVWVADLKPAPARIEWEPEKPRGV